MLSTQRGASVQRYTAAHELGHWILDHESAFDTEADLYYPTQDREQLAQIFASQLLMPPPLVYAVASRYGVTNSASATAPQVYMMARDMGASYEAVVRQLDNLEVISRHKRDELLAIQPATIKTQLALGRRPVGNVDVWAVDARYSGRSITLTQGDELIIALPENRTTGYQWLTSEELQERSARRIQPPPPIDPEAQIHQADADWRRRGRSRPTARARTSTARWSHSRETQAPSASCLEKAGSRRSVLPCTRRRSSQLRACESSRTHTVRPGQPRVHQNCGPYGGPLLTVSNWVVRLTPGHGAPTERPLREPQLPPICVPAERGLA